MTGSLEEKVGRVFSREDGRRVGNVKFATGTRRDVTAEQLVDQVLSADAQIAAGTATLVRDVDRPVGR